jgi:hypothetical protein
VASEKQTGRTEFVGEWVSKDVVIRHRTTTYIHTCSKKVLSNFFWFNREEMNVHLLFTFLNLVVT